MIRRPERRSKTMSVLLDNEISKLKKSILVLCGMVENAVADAVDAVMTSNQEKAEKCIWRGLYLLQQCKEKVDGSN